LPVKFETAVTYDEDGFVWPGSVSHFGLGYHKLGADVVFFQEEDSQQSDRRVGASVYEDPFEVFGIGGGEEFYAVHVATAGDAGAGDDGSALGSEYVGYREEGYIGLAGG